MAQTTGNGKVTRGYTVSLKNIVTLRDYLCLYTLEYYPLSDVHACLLHSHLPSIVYLAVVYSIHNLSTRHAKIKFIHLKRHHIEKCY